MYRIWKNKVEIAEIKYTLPKCSDNIMHHVIFKDKFSNISTLAWKIGRVITNGTSCYMPND
jgi:hypothetical protein